MGRVWGERLVTINFIGKTYLTFTKEDAFPGIEVSESLDAHTTACSTNNNFSGYCKQLFVFLLTLHEDLVDDALFA